VAPLEDRLGVRVGLINDARAFGLAELRLGAGRGCRTMAGLVLGTGVGGVVVVDGRVHFGHDGTGGELGHQTLLPDGPACTCGNRGCLEAFAGGGAMALRLREQGLPTRTSRDVVDQVRAGRPEAVQLIREAGRTVGGVLATCVNMLNPAVIVIGGDVARADEPLMAGIREVVYRRSLPLATGRPRIVRSQLDDGAGVIGAAVMVLEDVLAPAAVDAALSAG
jgi:predicted NBD/HSP70 family sugar kinase